MSDSSLKPQPPAEPVVREHGLRRLIPARLRSAEPVRQKTFFDSPGLLEQSHHWGGLVIWTIAAGTTAGLLWAFLGKVDQTVSASGTLVPIEGEMTIKSPSGGIVRQLWVKDGQMITAGAPLLRVENDGLRAQLLTAQKQLALLRYENTLYNLLLDSPAGFRGTVMPAPPALIAGDERTRSIQLTVQQTAAQLRQLQARLSSLVETMNLKQQLVNSLRPLYLNGGFAKFNYLNAVDELQQIRSRKIETEEQVNTTLAQAGRQVSTNDRQILDLEARLVALNESQRNLLLKAVKGGRIFNLAVAPGSVINGGAAVMEIIPNGRLKANLYLPNSDVGFVRPGMRVNLAVSSFPPGEYGYLKASVLRIGADSYSGGEEASAAAQQRAGTYPLVVQLDTNPGKEKMISRLTPGMQVSGNIIVRQRPVITLLTDVFTKGSEDLKNSR